MTTMIKPTTTFTRSCVTLAWLLGVIGCRGPMPCSDCDDQADEAQDDAQDDPPPDLPCGGADLMTDPLNCGSCGNDCSVWYPGTPWEAGGCIDGECAGIGWSDCTWHAAGATCEEICAGLSTSCLAKGCSGLTALLVNVGAEGFCDLPDNEPYATMDGPCNEPIPWMDPEGEFSTYAACCCT